VRDGKRPELTIKLIATDLDGTLLDSHGRLPEKNVHAIAEAAARGMEIVVVTGRRFPSAQKIASELTCDVHLIASNGAVIKSREGETHYRRLLPVVTARQVLEATPEYRSSAAVIFDRPLSRQVIFERVDWDNPRTTSYLRSREQVAEIVPLTACLDGEDPVEILFLGECEEMRRAMRSLEALSIAPQYALALTEYEQRDLSMLDVLNEGVTKGSALAEWARRRGIARDEVMAIGDNWNDREMLAFAGLPVVMENAVPELKSLGWKVTLSNDACGVADAIRRYALNQNGTG
jgi:Cof subfamily protein (haloacid dehalogenase superfamily)